MTVGFVTLDGLMIPIRSRSSSYQVEEIGSRGRAFDGTYHTTRRAHKRVWRMTTPMIPQADAEIIRNVILGRGELWRYNIDIPTNGVQGGFGGDLFSNKGVSPGLTTGNVRIGRGVDGMSVGAVESTDNEAKHGDGALVVEGAITNLLPADERTAGGTPSTDYTTVGSATISTETSDVLIGNQAARVACTGSGDGIETSAVASTVGLNYTGSVYLHADGSNVPIQIEVFDDNGGSTTDTLTIGQAGWQRFMVTHNTVAGSTTVGMRITKTTAGAGVFIADGFQIEQSLNVRTWINGTKAANNLRYPPTVVQGDDVTGITISMWVRRHIDQGSAGFFLNFVNTSGLEQIGLLHSNSGEDTDARFVSFNGNVNDVSIMSSNTIDLNEPFRMITVTYDIPTGVVNTYLDGVFVATLNLGDEGPSFEKFTDLYVGWDGATPPLFLGLIDDLRILPYAASASQIAGWTDAGQIGSQPYNHLPRAVAEGDFLQTRRSSGSELTAVLVEGELGRVNHREYAAGAVADDWLNNAEEVAFQLHEVRALTHDASIP